MVCLPHSGAPEAPLERNTGNNTRTCTRIWRNEDEEAGKQDDDGEEEEKEKEKHIRRRRGEEEEENWRRISDQRRGAGERRL